MVIKLNDFEEGLIEGNAFPKQNFTAGLISSITKEYEKYSEGEFKIKLVRVLSSNEEIFGTKVNGSYTDIIGKGYAMLSAQNAKSAMAPTINHLMEGYLILNM